MKEIPETCPSCGAFRDADRDEYDCGTRMTGPGVEWRSPQCEYRENQNLRSEITKLDAATSRREPIRFWTHYRKE